MKFESARGATPLSAEDKLGLKPYAVRTQAELNFLEEENIQKGILWAQRSRIIKSELLSWKALRKLHIEMFGDVWSWAGQNRVSETNIGCDPAQITESVTKLLDDVRWWINNRTFESREVTVRLHHRLVAIHPFRNGNGRHSRLVADLLARQEKFDLPTWGGEYIESEALRREQYLSALRAADKGNYDLLLDFCFRP